MYTRGYESQSKIMISQMNFATQRASVHQARIATGDSFSGKVDNPVDIMRASRMESIMRGSQVAERNIQDGIAFIDVKESSLSQVDSIAQRLREISLQYEDDNSDIDKEMLKKEALSLLKEIEHTGKSALFNGQNVFDKSYIVIQAGANSGDKLSISGGTSNLQEVANGIKEMTDYQSGEERSTSVPMSTSTPADENLVEPENTSQSTFSLFHKGGGIGGAIKDIFDKFGGGKRPHGKPRPDKDPKPETKPPLVPEDKPVVPEGPKPETLPANPEDTTPVKDKDWLTSDFIDKNILQPVSKERASVAIQRNRLEHRLDSVVEKGHQAGSQLSRIRDTDVAKEMMAMTKQKLLADVNANLLSRHLGDHSHRILKLLS